VGRELASRGVTGVTDATPGGDVASHEALASAVRDGLLPQTVTSLGLAFEPGAAGELRCGPHKILLDDRHLPSLDDLCARVCAAHAGGRPVAIHCVTRAEAVLALEALRVAGSHPGDRIEHASLSPPDLVELLVATGVTVVTQPNFVRERGDQYLSDVEPRDLPWLYRCAGLEAAGVPVGAGTDAPFGEPDPWLAMQAAVDRRTESGSVLGADEAVTPERALALFTTPPEAPGGSPRSVSAGAPADLCLLSVPWQRARERLDSGDVAATIVAGRVVWRRG